MTEQNSNTNLEELYPWIDDVTKEGADYEPNDLNNNLMHLKYVHRPKNVAGRNIGDIFWTMRVDETINGAYPCDGGEFMEDDFSGENNPYELLVLGRIPSVTYAEYAAQMEANNGNCGFFALDTENNKFKLPTLHKISIEATKITGNIGDYIQDQIVNITGKFGSDDRMTQIAEGAFSAAAGTYNTGSTGSEVGTAFEFSASKVVNTGDRVKPRTISLRAMVQLANEVDDAVSIESYTNRIEIKTQEGISALSNASSCLTQSQVTNCVLESPRKINVEINSDGQLVLKAGSVVVYPDSATKTFKEYTTTRDYVSTGFNNRQQTLLLNMQGGEESWGTLDGIAAELYCSSTTPVISGQYAVWLNLETFETKYTNNSGSSWQSIRYSMPFVIATCSASAYTSIDSVLDNFTFFGTYLMVRDDVKVLAPSGRNQDGTLNNKLITSVMSGHNYNFNGTTDAHLLLGNDDNSDNGGVICAAYYDYSYNNEKNTIQLIDTEYTCALCGEMKIVNSRITYLKEDEAIKLLNIQQVTHAGMPSNSVQVLSWPSSGSVFTAPADGYYHARGYSQTSAWTSLSLDNIEGKLGSQEVVAGIAGSGLSVYLPAAKGQRVSLHYENLGDWPTNNVYREFRFIPTKGAAGEV